MSSTVGATARFQSTTGGAPVRRLFTALSLALLSLIIGLAAILLARRLSGVLNTPLSGGAVVLAALAVELTLLLYRCFAFCTEYSVLSTHRGQHTIPPRAIFSLILPELAALAILTSLTIRGTPAWGILLAWLLLISTESIQWLIFLRLDFTNIRWPSFISPLVSGAADLERLETPRGLVQQITRTKERDRESLHAILKAQIATDDRVGIIHLAFCPPLPGPPELTAHALDADEAEIRITQAETFGARLEVRLPRATTSARDVHVEVLGSATARQTS